MIDEEADTSSELIRRWLTECVLALDLCPFASPVVRDDSLRIAISQARDPDSCLRDFLAELDLIQSSPEQELSTTLLAYQHALGDFTDYLELLDQAQEMLERAALDDQFQLASFHPLYLFEGEDTGALSNYTNRSPLPVIHIIRANMVSRALANYPDPEQIPQRNIERLEALGREHVETLWEQLQKL